MGELLGTIITIGAVAGLALMGEWDYVSYNQRANAQTVS